MSVAGRQQEAAEAAPDLAFVLQVARCCFCFGNDVVEGEWDMDCGGAAAAWWAWEVWGLFCEQGRFTAPS